MTGWVAFLQNLGCAATALVGLAVAAPARRPWRTLATALGAMFRDRRFATAWGLYLAVIGADIALTAVDGRITAWTGFDFTPAVARLDGNAVAAVQRWTTPWADVFFTTVYILLFPQAIILCLVLYTADRDWPAMRQLLAGFVANYLLALPFYLFFPVREAWHFSPAVSLRMDAVHPVLMEAYRPLSGIDNCFPSLHTSLAVTAFLVSRDHPRPRLPGLLAVVAGLTILSTVYLGIHWIVDIAAGILLALLCHRISRRF